ncbi:TIGR00299 family protein [Anaerobacillus arseniciselenatis]|uniref:TIGR00299 family protein n=1 Tax=Anaerobacillus arseniciselenatis TaxID=85682 RepID=A0A1S2L6T2_9BACI|nr:nickel pincer cofactor biosynthesis protein LarC [Anaerobacillus arseniciselenatis]OIJ08209.1 TIGR00299 family protein [Anaerobacillus arseniciselenatis]
MKTLYFDCFSGISGDMTIGALLDLGADPNYLEDELRKLNFDSEYKLTWEKVVKKGVSATKFDVLVEENNHDHHHGHHHHHEHHHHRHYSDIVKMIESADFNENVKKVALQIFEVIGRAEAKIHNMPFEKVHFHEVGGVDSIIDIVGTSILLDHLNISKVVSSSVPVGNGYIRIAHGMYPVPAPATLELLKGIPIKETKIMGELTTPTGAGILAVLAEHFGPIPSMKIQAIGYGAGTKDFADHPNVLRVMLGE